MADRSTVGTAVFSDCGTYRYDLGRTWAVGSRAVFVMLNPSTADAEQDDPTIRRCITFAHAWSCGGLRVLNAYALRSTDPKGLWRVADPVGPENDAWIFRAFVQARAERAPVVVAWGAHCKPGRAADIRDIARRTLVDLTCLGTTKSGAPRHPLYLPATSERAPWTP